MTPRWLWVATIVNAVLFLPAAYMAANAFDIVRQSDLSGASIGVAMLFLALPAFCIAAPFAAWRVHARGRYSGHTAILLASPLIYAAFLVVFLFSF